MKITKVKLNTFIKHEPSRKTFRVEMICGQFKKLTHIKVKRLLREPNIHLSKQLTIFNLRALEDCKPVTIHQTVLEQLK